MTKDEIILKIQEVKARGWDCIENAQLQQRRIQLVNQEIDQLKLQLKAVKDGDSDSI